MQKQATILTAMWATALAAGVCSVVAAGPAPTSRPARAGSSDAATSNLDYWLDQSSQATTQPTGREPLPTRKSRSGKPADAGFRRPDALPGVVELSDGRQIPGGVYTTTDQPWRLWVAKEKRWRLIPFIAVLSIEAVVVEEKMELEWRWKAMGEPERVYTGRKYPTRRHEWRFRLIDGTLLTGTIKGQPLWIEDRATGRKIGPYVLHERAKGQPGTTLRDFVYVRRVLVSRRAMRKVLATQDAATSRPAE